MLRGCAHQTNHAACLDEMLAKTILPHHPLSFCLLHVQVKRHKMEEVALTFLPKLVFILPTLFQSFP